MNDDLPLFRVLRDEGMARAADAQERDNPSFAKSAYRVIYAIARTQPTVHVDDVLTACPIQPDHPNSWGAVWMKARRNGIIQHSGQVRPCTTDDKKHGHQYPVYRSLLFRGAV